MGYLVNNTRPSQLTIGSTDYVANLVSFQVSDSSGFRNGIISTTGTIVLGTLPGQSLADYKRDDFKRGTPITFQVTYPSGNTKLHPRGLLYVISTVYKPEEEQVEIEVGCSLIMTKLLEKDDDIVAQQEVPLDPVAEDFESVSSSIAAAAKVMWQDNTGTLQKAKFFGADTFGTYETGAFVSVRGVTALAVQPLAATAAIPDELELSYQVPNSGTNNDNQGRVDTVTTESYYFLRYPAITYKRVRQPGGIGGSIDLTLPPINIPSSPISSGGCGNVPSAPGYSSTTITANLGQVTGDVTLSIPTSCSTGYETVNVPTYVPGTRVEVRTTTYDGPAAQVSANYSEIRGPALEANSQYFADKYAYCVATYANQCLPSGGCALEGLDQIVLGRQTTTYQYGQAKEVVRTVTSSYRPVISAAQPADWRSGINRGIPQDFDPDLSLTDEYLHQVVIRDFRRENNENVQETTTFTSIASRGGGIGADLNAFAGIKTSEIRRSVSTVTSDLRPDSVNSATTAVDTLTTKVQMHGQVGGYIGDYGPYVLKEDVPVPLLYPSESDIANTLGVYSDYLARYIEGDARGLQIAETLRETLADAWAPNMPFRYYDPTNGEVMAFRADACSWGADTDGCVVVMNGIWVADLSADVTIPSNLVGDAQPDMSDPNGTPVGGGTDGSLEPTVANEVIRDKRFNFHVNVNMEWQSTFTPSGNDGLRPAPYGGDDVIQEGTFVMWATGMVVQPGALSSLDVSGSRPIDFANDPIVDSSLVITEDLFATA